MQSLDKLCGSAVSRSFTLLVAGSIFGPKAFVTNILEILLRSFLCFSGF